MGEVQRKTIDLQQRERRKKWRKTQERRRINQTDSEVDSDDIINRPEEQIDNKVNICMKFSRVVNRSCLLATTFRQLSLFPASRWENFIKVNSVKVITPTLRTAEKVFVIRPEIASKKWPRPEIGASIYEPCFRHWKRVAGFCSKFPWRRTELRHTIATKKLNYYCSKSWSFLHFLR